MKIDMRRLVVVAVLVAGLIVPPLFAQSGSDASATSGGGEAEMSESLRKALVELVRAQGFMQEGDVNRAVAKYMEAFSIDQGVRLYDDKGILNEILKRFSTGAGNTGESEDVRELKVKLKSAEVDVEQLTREKERMEAELQNLQEQLDETTQELEAKIEELESELADMHHKRNFWRGRYLRKQGYGYPGAEDGN